MARRKTRKPEPTPVTEPEQSAHVAQSEEQVPCKDTVAGSTPVLGSDDADDEPAPDTEPAPEPPQIQTATLTYTTKVCACCGSPALRNQQTCRYCGQSSWM